MSDIPRSYFDEENRLLRYDPNQNGKWIKGYAGQLMSAKYHINAQGWRSLWDYQSEKVSDKIRIVVIGDSFVEALQVDDNATFTYLLQQKSPTIEVYNFGYSGAALSQYLHVMRYVLAIYAPDIVIVNLVYNDFDEALRSEFNHPHFMQYEIGDDGQIIELPPTGFHPPALFKIGFRLALIRYIYLNLNYASRGLIHAEDDNAQIFYPDDANLMQPIINYTFREFAELAQTNDVHLLLTIDAPRFDIADGLSWQAVQQVSDYRFNRYVQEALQTQPIPLIDFSSLFYDDYQNTGELIGFEIDQHWNVHGHQLVADRIFQELESQGWLTP